MGAVAHPPRRSVARHRSREPPRHLRGRLDRGVIEYYKSCTPAGFRWVDITPDDIAIPAALAGGLAAGRKVIVQPSAKDAAGLRGFPVEGYADKDGTKLVNYLGFTL